METGPFERLSVRVAALLPADPAQWQRLAGGYRADPKWRVALADGSSVFVKVAADPVGAEDLRREAAVYRVLDADFLPRFVGWDSDDPPVLVLEDLSDVRWPPPYPADTAPLFDTLAAVAATAPPPAAHEPPAADDGTWWERVAEEPRAFLALGLVSPDWLETALPALDRAERSVDLTGDDLVHGDVFAGNLCFAPRGVVLVDWSECFRGDARFDVACALLTLRRDGAAVPPVTLADEAGWAALLAGHLAVVATRPPPSWVRPEASLRDKQIHDLDHALRWCAELLDLPAVPGSP